VTVCQSTPSSLFGQVRYTLKTPPRMHLTRHHGVFAPHRRLRAGTTDPGSAAVTPADGVGNQMEGSACAGFTAAGWGVLRPVSGSMALTGGVMGHLV
jgi:hypothetical protein